MNAKDYWQLFLDTGAPEAYLMYTDALKMEASHVPDNTRYRTPGHRLQ